MENETLKKANELNELINEYESALCCFEYDQNEYFNNTLPEGKKLPPRMITTNPRLIIEYDGDGREQQLIPMVLSDVLVELLKQSIKENLAELKRQFKDL
ncbi:hypothetical protein [Dysgonomonas gadei]|uniref:hypothetical protein n=1 Tax=Dysgonomonas gadei TaxID=156974 RepID=UPI003AF100DB